MSQQVALLSMAVSHAVTAGSLSSVAGCHFVLQLGADGTLCTVIDHKLQRADVQKTILSEHARTHTTQALLASHETPKGAEHFPHNTHAHTP